MQQATIYVANLLNKSVDLSPFNYDPNTGGQNELFIPLYDDDILFGGLGNDFIHGGPGDDAISGAEALPLSYTQTENPTTHVLTGSTRSDYNQPFNPGNALRYNPDDLDAKKADRTRRSGEFALYDEYDPLRKIMLNPDGTLDKTTSLREFFLNFNASEGQAFTDPTYGTAFSDGSDALFGDLGNDMARRRHRPRRHVRRLGQRLPPGRRRLVDARRTSTTSRTRTRPTRTAPTAARAAT